jgi:hypothetical protein
MLMALRGSLTPTMMITALSKTMVAKRKKTCALFGG